MRTFGVIFAVILVVLGIVFMYSTRDTVGKQAIVRILEDLNRVEKEYNRKVLAVRSKPEEIHRLRFYSSEFRENLRKLDLSDCPPGFRSHLMKYLELTGELAKLVGEAGDLGPELYDTSSSGESSDKRRRLVKRIDELTPVVAAGAMHVNKSAQAHGVKIPKIVPDGFTEEHLRNVSLDHSHSLPVVVSSSIDPETVRYMQPVYDGLFKRLVKLREIGVDQSIAVSTRLEAAEKTKNYVSEFKEAAFPKDFLTTLTRIEGSLQRYVNTQKVQDSSLAYRTHHLLDQERKCLEEFRRFLSDINRVATRHGCQIFEVP